MEIQINGVLMNIDKFEIYLKKLRKRNGDKLLHSSIQRYKEHISNYIDYLDKLKSKELIDFINEKLEKRPSRVLYSAFRNYLKFKGYNEDDEVFVKIKTPPKSANFQNSLRYLQSRVLTPQEVKRLITESKGLLKIAIAFMYDTACRRSELLKVMWGDILFLERPENNIHAEVRLTGKGQKTRTVYLTKSTADMLKEIKEEDVKKRIFVFYKDQKNKRGYIKNQDNKLYVMIRNLGREILGREISPHCMRHSKSQQISDSGGDVLGLSNYLGHSRLETSSGYIRNSSAIGKKTFQNYSIDLLEENK